MNDHFSIKTASVHLWRVPLVDLFSAEDSLFQLLSADEKARAARFKFEKHKKRFVAARATLRQVLSLYLGVEPGSIEFSYGEHGKPFLKDTALRFNLSHSEDLAVIALTENQEVGVDIEKTRTTFEIPVAQKYFNLEEYEALMLLPTEVQAPLFYQIWAKKEAVIKLMGKGIFHSTRDFSVLNKEGQPYFVSGFFIDSAFAAAFATEKDITEMVCFEWKAGVAVAMKDFTC